MSGASVCLCMIVRDEAAVIQRCLGSVRAWIDTWVICDTGSADGTQELIREALDGIPGDLYERPWRSFGENRTELMRLAAGRADYLLLLDADMTISVAPRGIGRLRADSYMLRHDEPLEYWIKRLVRGDRDWRYVGATHEYIACEGPEAVAKLDTIVIHHHADGGTRPEKFERDRRLLEQALREDPDDARSTFYLAQTYRDLGELGRAIELYERRAGMGDWEEEVFYSRFQVGVLRAEQGDWPAGMAALIAAWESRPQRLEPLYELAARLRLRGEYQSAFLFARRGVDRPQPTDALFVSPWVYRWGLLFEYSICAYWVGEARRALAACDRLLRLPDLPQPYREQTLANREHCLRRVRSTRAVRSSRRSSATGAGDERGQRTA